MKIICIDQDEKGGSRFSDHAWVLEEDSFTPPSPSGYRISPTLDAESILMMHHPAGYVDAWHTAPAVVLGTVLRGTVRIETSNLDTRILQVGDQFLACDLQGKGHRMFEVNGGPYDLALVVLSQTPNLDVCFQ